jgi:predicted Zn-dependent protease
VRQTNPIIPEGINVSQEHPVKEFASLAAGMTLLVIAGVITLSLMAGYLTRYIPFEAEQKLVGKLPTKLMEHNDPASQKIEIYLQALTNKLAMHQGLDNKMPITAHYLEDDTVNAGATLGGHILIFKGLLEKMPHENALAMVLAHEIAHIKHRDPILALGRGITIAVAMTSIAGVSDSGLLDGLFNQASMVTMLSFNRDQEQEADLEALQTLESYYGHSAGASALFETLQNEEAGNYHPPEFLSSHPLTDKRIAAALQHRQRFTGKTIPKLTQLPDFIGDLLNDEENNKD